MRCSRVQYLYDDYTTGTLALSASARIDQHLSHCPVCRDFYETNDDISELIGRGSEVVHPGQVYLRDLSDRVMDSLFPDSGEAIRRKPILSLASPHERFWSRQPLWASGAVAATLLLTLGLGPVFRGQLPGATPRAPHPAQLARTNGSFTPVNPNSTSRARQLAGADESFLSDEASIGHGAVPMRSMLRVASSPANPLSIPILNSWLPQGPKLGTASTTPVPKSQRGGVFKWTITTLRVSMLGPDRKHPAERGRIQSVQTQQTRLQEPISLVQTRLYQQGMELMRHGKDAVALNAFAQVIDLDPNGEPTPHAHLKMGDIHFEAGDFEDAGSHYKAWRQGADLHVFSALENDRVNRRLDVIRLFADRQWQPLKNLHRVGADPWPEALEAMQRIAADPDGKRLLLTEAAQTVIKRLKAGDMPGDFHAKQFIELIANHLSASENIESRAWLQMTIGDLLWFQYENIDGAIAAYQKVLTFEPETPATANARDQLRRVRHRKLERLAQ